MQVQLQFQQGENLFAEGPSSTSFYQSFHIFSLHAAARLKQQREIEMANQAMLKRLKNTKPVIQKKKQVSL